MPYSSYNASLHPEIEPFIDDIEGLEPSGKYWIRGLTPDLLNRIRYQLYTWMHSEGTKPYYKIQSFPGELLILRRGLGTSVTTQLESPPLAPKLEELLTIALGAPDPGAFVKMQKDAGSISVEEMGVVLDRLGRILE